jgi:hypothetical protein
MAFTRQDLEAVERAIVMGESVVRFSDGSGNLRVVEYRSSSELQKVRDIILDELAQEIGPGRKRYYRLFHAGKGF